MTVQRSEIEQAQFELVKTLRTAIRLKHAIAADRELNEVLPAAEKAFTKSIQRGQLPGAVDLEGIVRRVVGE